MSPRESGDLSRLGAQLTKVPACAGTLLLALAISACTQPQTAPTPPAHPTIVSLNPCTDAILAEVADPAQILAVSHYSHDPAATSMDLATARGWPATAGTVEEILALKPDIVVASTFLPPATAQSLARLNIRVEPFAIPKTVAESHAQVRRLAALSGRAGQGEGLIARTDAALAKAATHAPPIPTLVWQSGGLVPGGDSLIAELLTRTGFAHFSAARGLRQGEILPLEEVLADPPRLILPAGNPHAEENRLLDHPALAALTDTRREPLASNLLWCGGPTILRAVERLKHLRESPRRRGPHSAERNSSGTRSPPARGLTKLTT